MYEHEIYHSCGRDQANLKEERRKQKRRGNLRLFTTCFAGFLLSFLVGALTGCSSSTATDKEEPSVVEHAEPNTYWQERTKEHDFDKTLVIKHTDDTYSFYYGDTVAAGVCHDSGIVCNTEVDSGFVLSVVDNDSVSIRFYNNSDDEVEPVLVTADVGGKTATSRTAKEEYIVKGYSKCKDGFGLITMELSNGYTLEAGVFKENGQLYVCNIIHSEYKARTINKGIKTTIEFLVEQDVTPENSVYTDPSYYPIVPVNKGEKTDVKPWMEQSDEIVEDDWTDAHKIYAMYEWCLDNFAYDEWIVSQGEHSRWFHYNDFTGKIYFSQTHVGVCEDFSQAFAIMCRAQGIPAIVVSNPNPSVNHAWNAVYIADYDRWILLDLTEDVNMQAATEDVTAWKPYRNVTAKCKNFDMNNGCATAVEAFIGNTEDMKRQGIIE